MKRLIIAGLVLASVNAVADCYVRSNVRLSRAEINAGPTDFQKLVVPDVAGQKCVVRYRV